ncbi:hypothetical protein [Haloechinothrix salitolerans]|uniref:EfeO-type cupredoxin-like domain-containing protein n=1 Tax=Haloechinothrix salitolerans TaxID=926830 RepID=A0ABW2C9Q4_9PSEU
MLKHTLAIVAALTLALAGCGTDADTAGTNGPAGTDSGTTTSSAPTGTTDSASAVAVSFTVEGGERVSGPEQLEVAVGERVAIEVTSDTADELHVHGYNKTVALTPGEPATLEFEATIAGVWEIELHDSGNLLTELRVTP